MKSLRIAALALFAGAASVSAEDANLSSDNDLSLRGGLIQVWNTIKQPYVDFTNKHHDTIQGFVGHLLEHVEKNGAVIMQSHGQQIPPSFSPNLTGSRIELTQLSQLSNGPQTLGLVPQLPDYSFLSGMSPEELQSVVSGLKLAIPELKNAFPNLENISGPVSAIVHQGFIDAISNQAGVLGEAYRQCAPNFLDDPLSSLSASDPTIEMQWQMRATETCMRNVLSRRP